VTNNLIKLSILVQMLLAIDTPATHKQYASNIRVKKYLKPAGSSGFMQVRLIIILNCPYQNIRHYIETA
jgi:hypothetical protein